MKPILITTDYPTSKEIRKIFDDFNKKEEWITMTIEDQMEELLMCTGKKPNLFYLGNEVAVRLGIPREDLDLYRDDSGIVCINNK